MPYTFYEGFGNVKVLNDLRARGYYIGSAGNTFVNNSIPIYPGAAVNGTSISAAQALPGNNTSDPFCAQLSGRTMNQLWNRGGFALYWRAMSWIPGSNMRMPVWTGTQWILPLTNLVTGSWLGTSTNGMDYNFAVAAGAQNNTSTNSLTGQSNPVYEAVSGQTMWADTTGSNTVIRYGNPTAGFSEISVLNGIATNNISGMYTNAGRTVVFGSDGSFPFCKYSDNGGAGPWVALNVTGNAGVGDFVRSPTNANAWAYTRVVGGLGVSTNNLATSASVGLPVVIHAVAASATAIVGVGSSSAFARTTASDISVVGNWTTGTLPVASQTVIGIAYGNGKFVAMNGTYIFVSSDDGLTWTSYTTASVMVGSFFPNGITAGKASISFQNGRFVVHSHGTETSIHESTDGINWKPLVYAYNSSLSGTTNADLLTTTGLFTSDSSGVPYVQTAANNIGFLVNSSLAQNQPYAPVVGSVRTERSSTMLGVNQWHEFQIVCKPTATVNNWSVTTAVDGIVVSSSTYDITFGNAYPWFNMTRRGTFTSVGCVVFYEMTTGDTTTLLGPDLRIYTDRPATDEQAQWNRTESAPSNAAAVATGTITNPPTSITESAFNQTDQYTVSNSIPALSSVLSVQNETYFSRLLSNTAFVSVGMQVDGQNVDRSAVQVTSPVSSWTYVNQRHDLNPVTSAKWTPATVADARFRISRVDNTPVTTFLLHCDGTQGSTTVTPTIALGGGFYTAFAGAALSTTDPKFGTACMQIPSGGRWELNGVFGGPGSGLGLSDFTIEMWVKTTTTGAVNVWNMDSLLGGNTGAYAGMILSPGGIYMTNGGSSATWNLSATPSGVFNNGQWRHVAVCRQGPTFFLFIDGQPGTVPTATNANAISAQWYSGTTAPNHCPGLLSIGAANNFVGFIDEIRVSRGCRYTAAFTPPTAPFVS